MNKKQKKVLIRVIVASVLLILCAVLPTTGYVRFATFMVPYLVIGYDILKKAWKGILNKQVFDENFLMSIATIGAISIGEYPEAVMVMVLYQTGEYLQDKAVEKSRKSISELMNIRPDYANIELDGKIIQKNPLDIKIGDAIIVKTGEKIPLDGIVIEGKASVDTSALTGEPVPKEIKIGDNAVSGCINTNGYLKIKVEKEFGESTVSKILKLVEHAGTKKAKAENFITKFARYYTPAVVLAAILLAVIPPLVIQGAQFTIWLERALTFLVISCPCAIVISVPLGFFAGIGGASRAGILVKGSCYMEGLSKPQTVVFDKTGTLTKGTFKVTEIHPLNVSENELLRLTALAERYSNHPIALSLKEAYGNSFEDNEIQDIEEISGYLRQQLEERRREEIARRQACVGPHRDDIEFKINGLDAVKFASQGQQRTIVLSLKLSELEIIKAKTGFSPILLLDDVLAELDETRQNYLLKSIEDDTQTIITSVDTVLFEDEFLKDVIIYKIEAGRIAE